MSGSFILGVEKMSEGIKILGKSKFMEKDKFETEIGNEYAKELLNMRLIKMAKEGDKEIYKLSPIGESLYLFRRRFF